MFMNAEPRFVSNGFETFVPSQRAESLHQRLVEMTNNEVNAWSVFRPAASSATDTWDLDDFGNENFSAPLYAGYFQNSTLGPQNQGVDLSKTVSYTTVPYVQGQGSRKSVAYQDSTPNMNCYEQSSPMLGHDYAQLSLGRGRGSFAEFSNARQVFKDFKYHPSTDRTTSEMPVVTSSGISASAYSEDASNFNHSLDITRTSPDTAYSNYSPRTTPAVPQTSASLGQQNTQQQDAKSQWWPGSTRSTKNSSGTVYGQTASFDGLPKAQGTAYGHTASFDGLPKVQVDPPQYSTSWNMTSTPAATASKWKPSTDSSTISPKALTLNPSSASLVSSNSSQEFIVALSMSSTTASVADGVADQPGPEDLVVVEPQAPIRRPRQALPDARPSARIVPMLPSNHDPPSRNTRKRSIKMIEPESHARRSSPPSDLAPAAASRVHKPKDERPKHKKIELAPGNTAEGLEAGRDSAAAATRAAQHHRDAKDDYLIRSKLAGMSYKEIRSKGKFTEAESTLRGRFRTLTKHKAARVRKPEWSDNDIRLLKRAVRKLARGDPAKGKVPWKQVAEYISNHGGSYHFGNATCRKRWDELQESE